MGDEVTVLLSYFAEASSLGKVPSKQAVEVFVAATLPRPMWIGEVAADIGGPLQQFIAVELGAAVPGDRLERQAAFVDQLEGGAIHCRGSAAR